MNEQQDKLFDSFQEIKGSEQTKQQLWKDMKKQHRNQTKHNWLKKWQYGVGLAAAFILVMVFGYPFLHQGNKSGDLINSNEKHAENAIHQTVVEYQSYSDNWGVYAKGYSNVRYLDEKGKTNVEMDKSGKLYLTYLKEIPEKNMKVEIEGAGVQLNTTLDKNGKLTLTTKNLAQLGPEVNAIPLTIKWNNQTAKISLKPTVKEDMEQPIQDKIPLSSIEGGGNWIGVATKSHFSIEANLKDWVEPQFYFELKNLTETLDAKLYEDQNKANLTLKLEGLNPEDKLQVIAKHELGEEQTIISEQKVKQIGELDKNNSLEVNKDVTFSKDGRWQFIAKVNDKIVGKIGIEVIPRF